ncbi:hypothetical protein LTR70_003155 [Exophiala xenobiotica]|uniref:Uncharacterized protein n=1 Tax=Lithohypha guttulata TaxID=1690604 RepID=A0ABR0KH03_9EURO|nr:hypothetical protein LTR24_002613 [Lithohypha guttulata]KAK5323866.1 hypothetical protein LTR70_003155 [Exophiala xenobiotica]
MAEDLKSSAHVWGDGKIDQTEESPPAYSGAAPEEPIADDPVASATTRTEPRRSAPRAAYDPVKRFGTLAAIPYHKYDIVDGALSSDKISLTVKHSDLYSHPQHLLPFVLEQAVLPPKPTLRIVGSHCGDRVDFDITLNLTHLLNLRNYKWRFNSAQVTPLLSGSMVMCDRDDSSVPTRIATSVKQFCKDRGENKSFTMTRTVEGMPTEMLAGQVRNLAASVKYRGLLRIDFTDERSKVVVHKQPGSWFSNILGLHPEKKYASVETVWNPWSGSDEGSEHGNVDVGLRAGQEWWQSWTSTIRNAIIVKHRGNIGIEDWIETRMGRVEAEPRVEWGRDHSVYDR